MLFTGCCCLLSDKTGKVEYSLFLEPHHESANTVVSQLHRYICNTHFEHHNNLFITADNHSTNKCNTMLQYLEWMVRDLKLFKAITLVFALPGHTKNRLDEHHALPAQNVYKHNIFNIDQLQTYLAPNSKYSVHQMNTFWDWNTFFESARNFHDISVPHAFLIQDDGIRSKLWADDEWGCWDNAPRPEPVRLLGDGYA